jgi:hypothetical protein
MPYTSEAKSKCEGERNKGVQTVYRRETESAAVAAKLYMSEDIRFSAVLWRTMFVEQHC